MTEPFQAALWDMRDYLIINENLRHALAAFSFVRETGETVHRHGLSLAYAGVPYGLFNTALITSPAPGDHGSFEERLDEAEAFFERYASPWSVWFCEDLLTPDERRRARIVLAVRGLRLTMETPGMIARAVAAPRQAAPPVEYRRVGDERTRRDFSRVMSSAFQVPDERSRQVYMSERLWQGTLAGWIAYREGEARSTACIITGGGVLGVYAVGTHPRHQRRGYGEAVMRHALAEAQRSTGLCTSVLQSSSAGYSLYCRMGYRDVTRFQVFSTGNES